jgi:hypothetical protein
MENTGPWRVGLEPPALVLNNRRDPATPHRNAVRITHLLPGSRLMTVEGSGMRQEKPEANAPTASSSITWSTELCRRVPRRVSRELGGSNSTSGPKFCCLYQQGGVNSQ